MTNEKVRNAALKDTLDLYASLMSCNTTSCDLPAVSTRAADIMIRVMCSHSIISATGPGYR